MNSKLSKIAEILGLTLGSDVNNNEENLSAEGVLMDGTKVMTEGDDFIVGAVLQIVAEDGTMTPAAEGEYTLDNGKVLVVDATGAITEVKEAAPEEPAGAEDGAPADPAEEAMSAFTLSEEDYNSLVERLNKLEEVLLATVEKLSENNKDLNEKVEKLSKEPAGEPVKTQLRTPRAEENALKGLLKNKK